MRTSRSPAVGIIALLAIACVVIPPRCALADWIGDYYPLIMGATWTYQNADPPYDQYTESVFEQIIYEGHTAVRRGEDLAEHTIAAGDGQIVHVYAEVHGGILYDYSQDVTLGEFEDGTMFEICPGGECDTLLIRRWSAIDPALRDLYDIDPALDDVVLISSYDRDYEPNLHNLTLASNLPGGVTPPTGAVTNMDWYQRDVGLAATRDIDAQSGGFGDYYFLVDYAVAVLDDPATPGAVVLDQNYPNPFNPGTTIGYSLTEAATVWLTVHDAAGRLVRTIEAGASRGPGLHAATWNGRNDRGRLQPSGAYFCRLHADGAVRTMRMTLVR